MKMSKIGIAIAAAAATIFVAGCANQGQNPSNVAPQERAAGMHNCRTAMKCKTMMEKDNCECKAMRHACKAKHHKGKKRHHRMMKTSENNQQQDGVTNQSQASEEPTTTTTTQQAQQQGS